MFDNKFYLRDTITITEEKLSEYRHGTSNIELKEHQLKVVTTILKDQFKDICWRMRLV